MANPDNIKPYRWKPGQSGNPKGRPKKEHELRWYLEGAMLVMPIAPEYWRNAMVILGLSQQVKALDEWIKSGKTLQDSGAKRIVPLFVRKLKYGEYGAMRACFDAGKNPELFLKIIEQIHGKPVQPTTVANPDGSPIKGNALASNVVVVTVPVEEDESDGKKELQARAPSD